MRWTLTLRRLFRALFKSRQLDRELDEELSYHLDRLIQENLGAGMPSEAAREAALRAMGAVEQRREECRDVRGVGWVDDLAWDLRFALRTLSKSRQFAAVAVGSLALGIGVNAAIFSAVNGLLLRPLPYPHADRLVWIDQGEFRGTTDVPAVEFVDWNEHSRLLEVVAAYSSETMTLTGAGEPERLEGFSISESFFPALGTSMLLGRNFLPTDERRGGEHVAILSHSLWRRRFASDQHVIGRSIRLNDDSFRIVGVLPEAFHFFRTSELWVPLAIDYQRVRGPRQSLLDGVFGRLREHVAPETAAAELETIRNTRDKEILWDPQGDGPSHVAVTPLHDHLLGGQTRRLLVVLLAAVALVLLIACGNVANLALARALVRRKEATIRTALGASRLRLLRQALAESLVLAAAGGGCGLVVAWSLTRVLVAAGPPDAFGPVTRVATIGIDGPVLLFTVLVSLLSGILLGIAPALRFSEPSLAASFQAGGHGLLQRQATRKALLVAQVALALVLLIGAGLLVRSFARLLGVDPGYDPSNLLTLRIDPWRRSANATARLQVQEELLKRVGALPGVESVATVNHLPLTDFTLIVQTPRNGRPGGELTPPTPMGIVSRDYFRTLGIRLRAGRVFDDRDAADAPRTMILSASEAHELFGETDPIGRQVELPEGDPPLFMTSHAQGSPTVIGVVDDVKHLGLDKETRPELYVHSAQVAPWTITLIVRSALGPLSLTAAVRRQVLEIDRELPVYDVMTMQQRLDDSIAPRRFTLLLLGGFALLALLLASIGVYGVIAYLVTQRTHEVGVRVALGARKSDVTRLFMKQGMTLVACGLTVGLFGALGLASVMRSLLFDIAPNDPFTFLMVVALLMTVALVACWLPARRAASMDALTALRDE